MSGFTKILISFPSCLYPSFNLCANAIANTEATCLYFSFNAEVSRQIRRLNLQSSENDKKHDLQKTKSGYKNPST